MGDEKDDHIAQPDEGTEVAPEEAGSESGDRSSEQPQPATDRGAEPPQEPTEGTDNAQPTAADRDDS